MNEKKNIAIKESGFTLIEVLITLVIASVIMAGLLLLFTKQSDEYKYQNNRIDTVQDAEFVINFIADDLRLALVSEDGVTVAPVEGNNFLGTNDTTLLQFDVWTDPASDIYTAASGALKTAIANNGFRIQRKYVLVASDGIGCLATDPRYTGQDFCLRYDREAVSADNTGVSTSEILPGVTMFKIFNDSIDIYSRASYPDIPPPLPPMNVGAYADGNLIAEFNTGTNDVQVEDPYSQAHRVDGYTILLEVAVGDIYNVDGKFKDAKDIRVDSYEAIPRQRVIRYLQVYPMSKVP